MTIYQIRPYNCRTRKVGRTVFAEGTQLEIVKGRASALAHRKNRPLAVTRDREVLWTVKPDPERAAL